MNNVFDACKDASTMQWRWGEDGEGGEGGPDRANNLVKLKLKGGRVIVKVSKIWLKCIMLGV